MLKPSFVLSNQDSNLDWLIQSQMCYHYTNGQCLSVVAEKRLFSLEKRVQKYYFFPYWQKLFAKKYRTD